MEVVFSGRKIALAFILFLFKIYERAVSSYSETRQGLLLSTRERSRVKTRAFSCVSASTCLDYSRYIPFCALYETRPVEI